MSEGYCNRHGTYEKGVYGCPDCRGAEKEAAEEREAMERAADERADRAAEVADEQTYKRNNPGEFKCPGCLFITLKRRALRCKECQFDIKPEYWQAVDAQEAEERAEQNRRREWAKSPSGVAAAAERRVFEKQREEGEATREKERKAKYDKELYWGKFKAWTPMCVIPAFVIGGLIALLIRSDGHPVLATIALCAACGIGVLFAAFMATDNYDPRWDDD